MKITKLEHSCLLVEMPAPVNRTAIFDPGLMSEQFLDVESFEYLDDIFISHSHADHFHIPCIQSLVEKFPLARVTGPRQVVAELKRAEISASIEAPDGAVFFDSKHEKVLPLFEPPEQIGVHYLDLLSHPGDSHSFQETKAVLALPVTGPWGSMVRSVNLALELKPRYVLPIHDWHWKDEAREQAYDQLEKVFKENDIEFVRLENSKPVVLDI